MKKHLGLLISLLAISLLSGCGAEHQHTFSDAWSHDDYKHWHAATCEHTDLRDSEGEHKDQNKNGLCDVCNAGIVIGWSEEELNVLKNHLYDFKLLFIENNKVSYDISTDSVILENELIDLETFNGYVNSYVSLGFTKENGPRENTYILIKDVETEQGTRTIRIDIFLNQSKMTGVCYDPYIYEWPAELIEYFLDEYFYLDPGISVPKVDASRYYVDTGYIGKKESLIVCSKTKTNIEESYKQKLIEQGLSISDTRDEDGYFVGVDDKQIIKFLFKYNENTGVFTIEFAENENSWPSFAIDEIIKKLLPESDTKIPAVIGADSYELIESSFDYYGYYSVLCESSKDLTASYEEALEDANYTIYNDQKNLAFNYVAISENNDLLLQYVYMVVESQIGGPDYKHFDVLFEPFYPHSDAAIANGLQRINKGTETVLPAYPGLGEKIGFSDTNKYMTIEIQSCNRDSLETYLEILDATWSVKALEPQVYSYEAISPDRDIRLESSYQNGRIILTLSAYEDPYSEWPVEGIKEICNTLGLEGTVPEFEGAFGFDYLNDDYRHDVVCIVKPRMEPELLNAYINKLEGLGYKYLTIGDSSYYIELGTNLGIHAYFERVGSGYIFIELMEGDGHEYSIDARNEFIYWKDSYNVKSNVEIPGIDLDESVGDVVISKDAGESHEGYYTLNINVEITDGEVSDAIKEVTDLFKEDGWILSDNDNNYHKHILWMNAFEDNGNLSIVFCAPILENNLENLIKAFIFDEGFLEFINVPDTIPVEDEYDLQVSEYDVDYCKMTATMEFDDHAKASGAKAVVKQAFLDCGWVTVINKDGTESLVDDKVWSMFKLDLLLDDDSDKITVKMSSTLF
ncbi:MAG: hypothetical protein KBS97_02505 [Firmicutes bacterium]|nr:hypothetical protein [Candidatus Fiminaster equi]